MAYVDNFNFSNYFEISTSGRDDFFIQDYVRPTYVELFHKMSPFAKALSKAGYFGTLAPEWETQKDWPLEIEATVADSGGGVGTITFASTQTYNGETLTTDLLNQIIKTNTVLEKEDLTTGEAYQIRVTATTITVDAALACVRHGFNAISADSAATEYSIITTSYADTDDFASPSALGREKDSTFTQIFQARAQITQTDKNHDERTVKDPWKKRIDDAMRLMNLQKAGAFVRGQPRGTDGSTWLSGEGAAEPMMAGILWWAKQGHVTDPNTEAFQDAALAQPTPKMLERIMYALEVNELATPDECGYQLWGHPETMQYVNRWQEEFIRTTPANKTVGFEKDSIILRGIKVPFKEDKRWRKTTMTLVPMKKVKYGHFKGGELSRKMIQTAGMYDQCILYEHIVGLIPDNKRWIGTLYNIRPYGT